MATSNPYRVAHHGYVHSVFWRRRRDEYLAGHETCESCGAAAATQVHHLNYSRLFEERDSDLEAVCSACHVEMEYWQRRSRELLDACHGHGRLLDLKWFD